MCSDFCDTSTIKSSKYRVMLSTFSDKWMIVLCFSSLPHVLARLVDSLTKISPLYMMMLFSTGTGLERVGVVGPDLDYWRAGLQALGSSGLR